MEEKNQLSLNHRVTIIARNQVTITGVRDVLSFDPKEVLLDTEMGILMLRGLELHVKRITLEKGEVDVEGMVNNMTYSDSKLSQKSNGSFFSRTFG